MKKITRSISAAVLAVALAAPATAAFATTLDGGPYAKPSGGLTNAAASGQNIALTAQWQRLVAYVTELEGKKATPVTAETKATYVEKLNLLTQRAEQKAKSQYERATFKAKNMRERSVQKSEKQIEKQRSVKLAKVKGTYGNKLDVLQSNYNKKVDALDAKYEGELKALGKQKTKLQKKIAKATNPTVRDNLEISLESLNADIQATQREYKQARNQVTSNYNERKNAVQDDFQSAKAKVYNQARKAKAKAKKQAKLEYNREVRSEKLTYTKDVDKVKDKQAEGMVFINEMPAVVS